MDSDDLARWTRFAMKGGIGKCVAICDCIAENNDDLVFLKVRIIPPLFHLIAHMSTGRRDNSLPPRNPIEPSGSDFFEAHGPLAWIHADQDEVSSLQLTD
jgi:hypothetical protein